MYIFFDYGGLLADITFNETTSNRAHTIAQKYICENLEDIKQKWSRGIKLYLNKRSKGKELSLFEIVKEAFKLDDLITEQLTNIYKINDHDEVLFPQTDYVLRTLAKTHTLGIISDCPHDSLKTVLGEANLLDLFDTITISYEIGIRKPNPEIYLEALRRAGARPQNSIYISHDLETDLKGAKNIGMQTRLIQPKNLGDLI